MQLFLFAAPPTVTLTPSLVPMNQTSVPVNLENIIQLLTPYSILYQIEQTRIPSISEYAELSSFTDTYLNDYFASVFAGTTVVFLLSITNITGSEFRLGQPVRVDYNTTMVFGFQSEMVPNMTDLDARLASAFEGTNGEAFAAAVAAGVDPSNIFSTTSTITFEEAAAATDAAETRVAMIAIISIMSVLVFVGGAVTTSYPLQKETFEKAPLQTDESTTDDERSHNSDKSIDKDASSPKCRVDARTLTRRYISILQTDTDKVESESSVMRVASSN